MRFYQILRSFTGIIDFLFRFHSLFQIHDSVFEPWVYQLFNLPLFSLLLTINVSSRERNLFKWSKFFYDFKLFVPQPLQPFSFVNWIRFNRFHGHFVDLKLHSTQISHRCAAGGVIVPFRFDVGKSRQIKDHFELFSFLGF
jgi:hypothetical protein